MSDKDKKEEELRKEWWFQQDQDDDWIQEQLDDRHNPSS